MAAEILKPVTMDDDFNEMMSTAKELARVRMGQSRGLGDFKKARYYSGIVRGIEMCQEGYHICLLETERAKQIREASNFVVNLSKSETTGSGVPSL